MKTLKKTLCLVLVLVMSLSLVTVAGAEYTDVAEDNPYAEAIEVMSAIKVLDGMSEDTFEPEGTLTRAQAAKIVTYMLLGKDVAEDLPNDTKPFEDVESGFWAAGSIAYLKEVGAVSGKTAKIFDPQAKVTGYEFGKMVLEAAGIEGDYTGAAWTINVVRDLNQKGLLTNLDDVKLSDNLTRGAAAQMAFNGLNYSEKASTTGYVYTIKAGTTALDGDVPAQARLKSLINTTYSTYAEAVENANAAWSGGATSGGTPTIGTNYSISRDAVTRTPESLGDTVFGLSKASITADNFGRPMTHYAATSPKASLNFPVAPDYKYEGKVTEKTVATDLGSTVVSKYTFTQIVDGVTVGTSAPSKTVTSAYNSSATGDVTEVYVDNGAKEVTVVTVRTYIGEVGRVTAATDDAKRFVTLKGGKTFTTESFKVGDVVLFTESKDTDDDGNAYGIQTMQLASTVTGTLTKIVTVGGVATYTVDGKDYTVNAQGKTGLTSLSIGKEVSFYVDTQGNIMQDITAGSASTNYIYVLAHDTAKTTGNYIQSAGAKTVEIYGVTPDGQAATYTAQGTTVNNWVVETQNPGLYSYTIDPATGNLVLASVTDATVSTAIEIGKTTVTHGAGATAILNSDTKFVFVETRSDADKTVTNVTVKTGNANIGSTIAAANAKIAVEDGVAKVVFVIGAYSDPTTDSGLMVLVDASTKQTIQTAVDGTTTTVNQYTAYTNDMQVVTVTSTDNITTDKVYKLNSDNSLRSEVTTNVVYDGEVTAINGSTVTIESENLNVTTDSVIYGLDSDTELKVGQKVTYVTGAADTSKEFDILVAWITSDQDTYTLSLGTNSLAANYNVDFSTATLIGGNVNIVNKVSVTLTAKTDANKFITTNNKYKLTVAVATDTDGKGVLESADDTITIAADGMSATFTFNITTVTGDVKLDISALVSSQS